MAKLVAPVRTLLVLLTGRQKGSQRTPLRWTEEQSRRSERSEPRTAMPGFARSPLLIAELIEQMHDPSLYRQDTPIRFSGLGSEIARMEEANHWPWTYLAEHDGPRRVPIAWLKTRAPPNERFSRLCRAYGWPKSTARDARARACGLIAAGLNGERKPVR